VVPWLAEHVFQYIAFTILPFLESWTWIPWYTIALLHVAGAIVGVISVLAMFLIWLERKVAAHIQDRLGPMRVGGWHGWAQSIADGIKLLLKEDIIPAMADRPLFILAPFIAFTVAFMSFIVLPFSQHIIVADLDIGILYIYGLSTITVIAIIVAGWASNNKWSLLGAVRSAAQLVSYEIPVGLSLLAGVVMAGSLSTVEISMLQSGGVWNWFIWRCGPFSIIAAILLYIGALAETNRTPFDLAEAESELVSGYHTEYSGFRFSLFFLAEYTNMFIASALVVILFLGGFTGLVPIPFVPDVLAGPFWFLTKTLFLVFVMMWIRWTLPRLRVDQLMTTCWKYLIPIALVNLGIIGLWTSVSG
jgi:NADH-quinone oxidoreductase subunit H